MIHIWYYFGLSLALDCTKRGSYQVSFSFYFFEIFGCKNFEFLLLMAFRAMFEKARVVYFVRGGIQITHMRSRSNPLMIVITFAEILIMIPKGLGAICEV